MLEIRTLTLTKKKQPFLTITIRIFAWISCLKLTCFYGLHTPQPVICIMFEYAGDEFCQIG